MEPSNEHAMQSRCISILDVRPSLLGLTLKLAARHSQQHWPLRTAADHEALLELLDSHM